MKPSTSNSSEQDGGAPSWDSLGQRVFIGIILVAVWAYAVLLFDHRSPWLDELASLKFADPELPFSFLLSNRIVYDPHPPLYYALLHLWLGWFGNTVEAARTLNFVPLALGTGAVWWAIRKGLLLGIWPFFCALFLTSYFVLFYVHDARSYAFLLAGALVVFLLLLCELRNIREDRHHGPWLFLALGSAAGFTSFLHYFGFLFTGLALVALFICESRSLSRKQGWLDQPKQSSGSF